MPIGLAHFNRAPTALTQRLEIVALLDKVSPTGRLTTSKITIFEPKALKCTDMNSRAEI